MQRLAKVWRNSHHDGSIVLLLRRVVGGAGSGALARGLGSL